MARHGRLWRGMGGYGAAWAAAVPRTGNTAFPVHRPSDISSGANQAPQPWFSRKTKHETRITAFTAVRFSVGARGVASPETAVRTTAPAGKSLFSSSPLFTIVRHCSPLFAIVHQKILSCASALVPPGRCFPARCGAAWAAAVPRTGNTAFRVFTKHETRDPAFFESRPFSTPGSFPIITGGQPGGHPRPARMGVVGGSTQARISDSPCPALLAGGFDLRLPPHRRAERPSNEACRRTLSGGESADAGPPLRQVGHPSR